MKEEKTHKPDFTPHHHHFRSHRPSVRLPKMIRQRRSVALPRDFFLALIYSIYHKYIATISCINVFGTPHRGLICRLQNYSSFSTAFIKFARSTRRSSPLHSHHPSTKTRVTKWQLQNEKSARKLLIKKSSLRCSSRVSISANALENTQ